MMVSRLLDELVSKIMRYSAHERSAKEGDNY